MNERPLIALTRRIPAACEERLQTKYAVRLGDDAPDYTPELILRQAEGAAAVIITPTEGFSAAVIAALPPTLKVISCNSVGFEHVDLAAARAKGLRVTHTPDVLADAVADHTLLLILAATRRAGEGERMVRAGAWTGLRPNFLLGRQITGLRLGIVGMGSIGACAAMRAQACGMKVLYHNRKPSDRVPGATFVPELDDLLRQSDVLSLHCPLTPQTKDLLNAARIALLPDGAVVINTARGGLVVDDDLIAALKSGKLYAAGLDVFGNEPNIDPRYRTLENVFLQPHVGSGTIETRTAMGMLAIDNLEAVLEGRTPPHPLV